MRCRTSAGRHGHGDCVLLIVVAATALTLLINKAGDSVNEKTGSWIGGLIALLAGSAITLILVNAAKQAGKRSVDQRTGPAQNSTATSDLRRSRD